VKDAPGEDNDLFAPGQPDQIQEQDADQDRIKAIRSASDPLREEIVAQADQA
jgi:hypothetical protein